LVALPARATQIRRARAVVRLAVVALLLTGVGAASLHAEDTPKWLKELRKDFANIDKARKNQAELHRGLVRKWDDDGHMDDVLTEYVARQQSRETDAPTWYGHAYAYAMRGADGDLESATVLLQRAIVLDPGFVLAYFTLGGVLHKSGDSDGALAAYAECVRIDETQVAAHYSMGEAYRGRGDTASALTAYNLAIELARRDWKFPHFGKAQVYYELEDDAQAEAEAKRALEIDDKFAPAYFLLGQIRAVQELDAEALDLYREGAKHGGATPPKELQNLARIFAYRGVHAEAEPLYRRALAMAPDDGPLHFDLAETLWARGEFPGALAEYRAAIQREPTFATHFTDAVQSQFFSAELSPADARVALDKAIALDAGNDEAHVLYAQVEIAVDALSEAVGHYERARELRPERPDIHFPLADIYFAMGDIAQAETALSRGAEMNPQDARRYEQQGSDLFSRGEYALAAPAYGKHALLFPADVDARYYLARCFEETGAAELAIAEYERVRGERPGTQDALVRLARLYGSAARPVDALGVLDELVGIEPENTDAHYARGEILVGQGNTSDAIDAFERVAAAEPAHTEVHLRLAGLYDGVDDDAALAAYERVIKLAPDNASPYFLLGAIHLRLGAKQSVIDVYTAGLLLQPRRAPEQYALAQLLDESDDLAGAASHYAVAVELKEDEPAWQYNYARCAHRLAARTEGYDERMQLYIAADHAYTASILLEPKAPAHFHRGMLRRAHRQIGESLYLYSEVAFDFEQVIAGDPENGEAWYALGLTYVDMEQDSKARRTFRRLLAIHPTYENAHTELGAISERQQEYQQAISDYAAEVSAHPDSAHAHYRLGYLYQASRDDLGTASEHLARAVELDRTNADAHVEYGRVLYRLDRLRAAADQFEHALKLDPRNLTANFNLAMVYQYLDKRALAAERFRYLLTLDVPGEWKSEAEGYLQQLEGQ
jgi:tetratricopeptide (TPR) repeat protein